MGGETGGEALCWLMSSERLERPPLKSSSQSRLLAAGLALVPLVLSAIVQFPATRGCFRCDDYLSLYEINNYTFLQYEVIPNAGHLYEARNAVFYLMWWLFGTAQAPYLWSSFLTHLLNVRLLYRVIDTYTESRPAAVFGATLWGACPLQAASIGYYTVYGHLMVAAIMLVVLWQAARAGRDGRAPGTALIATWYGGAILAMLSYGSGVFFAITLPFVLALLLRGSSARWRWRVPLISLLVVVPILYFALNRLYLFVFFGTFGDLTFGGRYMFFSTAAADTVRLITFALSRLSAGWLPVHYVFPAGYALLAVFVVALLAVAWRGNATVRSRVAACAVLTASFFVLIALTRGFPVDYDAPLDDMRAGGRFYYAPLIPLAILLSFLVRPFAEHLPRAAATLIGVWCLLTAATFPVDNPPVTTRCAMAQRHRELALAKIHASIAESAVGDTVIIANRAFPTVPLPVFFPGWAALFHDPLSRQRRRGTTRPVRRAKPNGARLRTEGMAVAHSVGAADDSLGSVNHCTRSHAVDRTRFTTRSCVSAPPAIRDRPPRARHFAAHRHAGRNCRKSGLRPRAVQGGSSSCRACSPVG